MRPAAHRPPASRRSPRPKADRTPPTAPGRARSRARRAHSRSRGAACPSSSARRQRRNDQAGEHQVDADQLHRRGDGERERAVEAEAARAARPSRATAPPAAAADTPASQSSCVRVHPQDLADQQVLQMLAAVRVAGQQQDAGAGREDEHHADQRLLLLRRAPLGPGQQQARRAAPRRRPRPAPPCRLRASPARRRAMTPSPAICAIARSMKTMPRSSTCMPSGTWVASTSRPAMKAGPRMPQSSALQFMCGAAAASRRATVSSNRPNRSFAPSVPPTVNGSFTAGMPALLAQPLGGSRVLVGRSTAPSAPACAFSAASTLLQVRRGRLDARLGLEHGDLLQAQPVVQVDEALVLRRPPAVPFSGAACALQRAIACCQRCAKSACACAYCAAFAGIDLLQPRRQRRRHQRDVARIGLDVRIAGGVHVALRAVELASALPACARSRPPRNCRAARAAPWHCPTAAAAPAASRSPVRRRCRPPDRRCARARSGSAWPGSGAGPAARWWPTDTSTRSPPSSCASAPHSGSQAKTLSAAWAGSAEQRRAATQERRPARILRSHAWCSFTMASQ